MPTYSPLLPYLLSIGTAIALSTMDIYTPCLPSMLKEFSASESALQFTFSANAIGYCLSGPLAGPLADAYGRRKVMLSALVLALISTLGCALAPTLSILYVARFFQGLFLASIPIVGLAVLTDVYSGRRLAKLMAVMGAMITFSFAVAPMIGGEIGQIFGWRSLFFLVSFLLVCLLVLHWNTIPETLQNKSPLSIREITLTYKRMMSDPFCIGVGLMTGGAVAGYFAYVTSSAYYYINILHLSPSQFGYVTGMGMLTNLASNLVVSFFIERYGQQTILRSGVCILAFGTIFMGLMTVINVRSPWVLMISIMLYSFSLGFIFTSGMSLVMEQYRSQAGSASAFLSSIRMSMLSLATFFAGKIYNETLFSISSVLIAFAGITVLTYWSITRRLDLQTV